MPEPVDLKLYKLVKRLADKKFESKSGVYKSSWIVREYLKRGGKYHGKRSKKKGLLRWYSEKWVDLNRKNKSCGRPSAKSKGKYPLCRPTKRVTKETPRTVNELSKSSIRKAKREKAKIKSSGNVQFGRGSKPEPEPEPEPTSAFPLLILTGIAVFFASYL